MSDRIWGADETHEITGIVSTLAMDGPYVELRVDGDTMPSHLGIRATITWHDEAVTIPPDPIQDPLPEGES